MQSEYSSKANVPGWAKMAAKVPESVRFHSDRGDFNIQAQNPSFSGRKLNSRQHDRTR
jgi:hypothetical protein